METGHPSTRAVNSGPSTRVVETGLNVSDQFVTRCIAAVSLRSFVTFLHVLLCIIINAFRGVELHLVVCGVLYCY